MSRRPTNRPSTMKPATMTSEIMQLRELMHQLNRDGAELTRAALSHLFSGRAAGYLKAMESLGYINIAPDGEVTL